MCSIYTFKCFKFNNNVKSNKSTRKRLINSKNNTILSSSIHSQSSSITFMCMCASQELFTSPTTCPKINFFILFLLNQSIYTTFPCLYLLKPFKKVHTHTYTSLVTIVESTKRSQRMCLLFFHDSSLFQHNITICCVLDYPQAHAMPYTNPCCVFILLFAFGGICVCVCVFGKGACAFNSVFTLYFSKRFAGNLLYISFECANVCVYFTYAFSFLMMRVTAKMLWFPIDSLPTIVTITVYIHLFIFTVICFLQVSHVSVWKGFWKNFQLQAHNKTTALGQASFDFDSWSWPQ